MTMQPASLNRTGYGTTDPATKYVIRRLLGHAGQDTPANRNRLSDLLDDAGTDPFVQAMIRQGDQVILTLELADGTFLAIPLAAYVRALGECEGRA